MTLTAMQIRGFPATAKAYKKSDEKGLYLEITPKGSKLWRWKYRIAGKEKRLALGSWPEISLAKARSLRDEGRAKLNEGIDPALERKKSKATAKHDAANNFELLATEYIDKIMIGKNLAPATITKARYFLKQLKPSIGKMALNDIDVPTLFAALTKIQDKGNYETAKKCRAFASRVFRHGMLTSRAITDPAHALQGALTNPKVKHYAAILDPVKFGHLLRAIDEYEGQYITKFALMISPHIFVRPGELRHARWSEVDFNAAIWNIPAEKMKARREHSVPLSKQVLAMLEELKSIEGDKGFIFPSFYTPSRPMSENTVNTAFRRMGFSKEEITAHGLRSTASTLLNESGKWNPDAIERSLAHGDSNAVRGAYHRGNYWQERVEMAQWWSDYLDQLKVGGDVIKLEPRAANI